MKMPYHSALRLFFFFSLQGCFLLVRPNPALYNEDDEATCNDGVDNDENGSFDCADPACADFCGPVIDALALGAFHTCVLAEGSVRCFGFGPGGRLGYGNNNTIGDDELPQSAGIVDVGGVVTQITAGIDHTCALLDTGSVRCWGQSYAGQLGYGTELDIGDDETPAQAYAGLPSGGDVDLGGAVVQIAAGDVHTCALLDTGSVRCWGDNTIGQLGYGTTLVNPAIGDDEPPSSAGDVPLAVDAKVIQIAAGSVHTCALFDTGDVKCWGKGGQGRLGYSSTLTLGDDEPASSVGLVPIGGKAVQITAGAEHTCALLDTGDVRCWGNGGLGRLGTGSGDFIGDDEFPVASAPISLGGKASQIVAGGAHTCALLEGGSLRCFGDNRSGQLGYGNTLSIGETNLPSDVGVIGLQSPLTKVAAGGDHTCALRNNRQLFCWGAGSAGQLGYGISIPALGDDETPTSVSPISLPDAAVQIATGAGHACALLQDGDVRCWGSGLFGRLGYGDQRALGDDEALTNLSAVSLGGKILSIDSGFEHTCALLDTNQVRCWGASSLGRLGYGDFQDVGDNEDPASKGDVNLGVDVVVSSLAAGGLHNCAILQSGTARCWGDNKDGQLGYGNLVDIGDDHTPNDDYAELGLTGDVDLGGTVLQVAPGTFHTCALLTNGEVRCFGFGGEGRLGYGNVEIVGDDELPSDLAPVSVGGAVRQLAAGDVHTCALLTSGEVRCWGASFVGQLGYGFPTIIGDDELPSSVPAGVDLGPSAVLQITAGNAHTCALLQSPNANNSGNVVCWGDNFRGQLGYGNLNRIGDDETPITAGFVDVGGLVTQIDAFAEQTCALLDDGKVRCWGDNRFGQLGLGAARFLFLGDDESPASAGPVRVF